MNEERSSVDQNDTAIAEVKLKRIIKKPPKYQVVLLNDDFTPMEFVIEILVRFFNMDEIRALQIMLQIHKEGKGVCGVYSRDVAETKVMQVNDYARSHNYPLFCTMEVV